jgi:hypothetical protein
MRQLRRILFAVLLLAFCWWAMMAVHELGHVMGAYLTGGTVTNVVLHPLAFSRTDVSPDPHPGIVAWMGPLIGVGLPLVCVAVMPRRCIAWRNIARFFAGFCLIANGAYISIGSFRGVGDCGEMLHAGAPLWFMIVFGAATIPLGLFIWHRLGSIRSL